MVSQSESPSVHDLPAFMSEINVRLPDGKVLSVPARTTVLAVAEQIGPGLAKAALAGRLDGVLVDLRTPLERDASIEIVTARDPDGSEVIRHSAEHIMADAVKRLFPDVQIDVGQRPVAPETATETAGTERRLASLHFSPIAYCNAVCA